MEVFACSWNVLDFLLIYAESIKVEAIGRLCPYFESVSGEILLVLSQKNRNDEYKHSLTQINPTEAGHEVRQIEGMHDFVFLPEPYLQ